MNKIIKILLSIILMCLAFTSFGAQDSQTLFGQIERVSQEREPKWKISRKLILRNSKHISIRWKSGKSYVQMLIERLDSPKEAADMFEGFNSEIMEAYRTAESSQYSKTELPNLGDKNYLWSHRKAGASILLRKGNAFVMLIAPSIDVAKRFAQLVADQLPAT